MTESIGTGYKGDGWLEEAEEYGKNAPLWSEIIMMEDELGIPNKKISSTERNKAWAYYHELKAQIEAKHRKTA